MRDPGSDVLKYLRAQSSRAQSSDVLKYLRAHVVPTDTLDELIQELQDHVDKIPNLEKVEYMEASERNPRLVHNESNPLLFLEYAEYNPLLGAQNLVLYWKVRKEVFGPCRAFLPMTIRGAMAADIEALRKGIVQLLPNDVHGRSVIFFDRMRAVKPTLTREEVFRIVFYLTHIVSQKKTRKERTMVVLACFKVRFFFIFTLSSSNGL